MFKFVMTKNSNELFHRAIIHNDIARTKLILEEAMRDPRFNIDEINDEGLTALQFSCFAGNLEIVKTLTSHRANYKIRDRDGYTLLHASAMSGHDEIVRYLLQIGLKPTSRSDDGIMPIDTTDEITTIVILLRAMLDQGFLQEMQEYMMDHPKLKRQIFKELEMVKCREKEKNEILRDLPYTSHTARKKPTRLKKLKTNVDRSLSTFVALSDSMQHLDYIDPPCERNEKKNIESKFQRQNSLNSCSSKGSKSSHSSCGILRNTENNHDDLNGHEYTQRYLESRFPQTTKTVTFEIDQPVAADYVGDYQNKSSRTSSFSSQSIADDCEPFKRLFREPIYNNAPSQSSSLTDISENIYENFPSTVNNLSPPLIPPRQSSVSDENTRYDINNNNEDNGQYLDRQLGSETDSGIDINETQGRIFALSLEDRKNETPHLFITKPSYNHKTFSKPIGLFYSNDKKTAIVKQRTSSDDNLPSGFFIRPSIHNNSKYMSWNGRSLQKELDQFKPLINKRKNSAEKYLNNTNQSKSNIDKYSEGRLLNPPYNSSQSTSNINNLDDRLLSNQPYHHTKSASNIDMDGGTTVLQQSNRYSQSTNDIGRVNEMSLVPLTNGGLNHYNNRRNVRALSTGNICSDNMIEYNYDYQPEIML